MSAGAAACSAAGPPGGALDCARALLLCRFMSLISSVVLLAWGATRCAVLERSNMCAAMPAVWGTLTGTQHRRERTTMPIVDAQIHTWGTGLPSNLSHWQITQFTPEQAIALMDAGGVDAAVIHPPGWDPNSTEMAFKAARDYPGRFAIMGSLPLDDPQSRARIATWREQPGMLGLRYAFLHEPMRQWHHGINLLRPAETHTPGISPLVRCPKPTKCDRHDCVRALGGDGSSSHTEPARTGQRLRVWATAHRGATGGPEGLPSALRGDAWRQVSCRSRSIGPATVAGRCLPTDSSRA